MGLILDPVTWASKVSIFPHTVSPNSNALLSFLQPDTGMTFIFFIIAASLLAFEAPRDVKARVCEVDRF